MRLHLFISGRVQGVFYRLWTKEKADKLGLTGWVKNLADGRVEAVFEGPESKLKTMVNLCYQGPAEAEVAKIEKIKEPEKGLLGFEIRY